MALRRVALVAFTFVALSSFALGQDTAKSQTPADIDFSAFVKETQQTANEPGYAGLVWWIPTDYWVISAKRGGLTEDKARQRFAPLEKYTVVAVALGKIGIGNIDWLPETTVRENVLLRDSDGNTYQPVQKVTGDAEGLASIAKPIFANILGSMGQNIQLMFFAASNKMAKPIADPKNQGTFSVVLTKLFDGRDKVFEWKLPLTALSPPKYCPVGKERVQANWKYCPWHGVKLDEPHPPAQSASQ